MQRLLRQERHAGEVRRRAPGGVDGIKGGERPVVRHMLAGRDDDPLQPLLLKRRDVAGTPPLRLLDPCTAGVEWWPKAIPAELVAVGVDHRRAGEVRAAVGRALRDMPELGLHLKRPSTKFSACSGAKRASLAPLRRAGPSPSRRYVVRMRSTCSQSERAHVAQRIPSAVAGRGERAADALDVGHGLSRHRAGSRGYAQVVGDMGRDEREVTQAAGREIDRQHARAPPRGRLSVEQEVAQAVPDQRPLDLLVAPENVGMVRHHHVGPGSAEPEQARPEGRRWVRDVLVARVDVYDEGVQVRAPVADHPQKEGALELAEHVS